MRCRKARSLLSAACSDELGIRRQAAVREHLASCPACRKEASYYMAVRHAAGELPQKSLSEDFNTRLLNRIAQERFKEARTAAYLPHRVPRLSLRVYVPAAVAVALALFAVSLIDRQDSFVPSSAENRQLPEPLDDRYLTVQPDRNPNLSMGLSGNWSLRQQLDRAERLDHISRGLTNPYGFGNLHLAGSRVSAYGVDLVAIPRSSQQVPVFRYYRISGGADSREDGQAY
ncbi:MAG: zf-HC2 domain-containing protein [Candidatus Zixiibacteriota bacterium]